MARLLITGITGFIAKHVAAAALRAGHEVRGTLREARRGAKVRMSLAAAGAEPGGVEFVEADLTSDGGWADAVRGADAVLHVASPFPLSQPREREALSPAARDGALRVIRAALEAGVPRVVLTSSMVAMMYRAGRKGAFPVRESDWSDPEWGPATPYIISKTRAERAAWAAVEEAGARDRLTAINPGFVLGPAFDEEIGASLAVIKLFLDGAYPAVPPVAFPVVDVRDLAALHLAAVTAPVGGRRLVAAGETITMQDMARMLRAALPERAGKIPTAALPAAAVRLLAAFDPTLKTVLPDLEGRPLAESAYVTELTGVSFRSAREAVEAAGRSLVALRIV